MRSVRSPYPILRRIARESVPVLVLAGTIDVIAGLTIEKRFEAFLVYPALLVLVPPFLEDSGALGSILGARVSTKLHLGTLDPRRWRLRAVGEDVLLIYLYAVPVFLLLGVTADIASAIVGLESPGSLEMIAVTMLAGVVATTFAVLVGFYGAVASVPPRPRPGQPRHPDRDVEPRPPRRARPDPVDRRPRLDLTCVAPHRARSEPTGDGE